MHDLYYATQFIHVDYLTVIYIDNPIVKRTSHRLMPDPNRVIVRLFIPGQEDFGSSESRAMQIIDRVLNLDEEEVCRALDDVYNRFIDRHDELTRELVTHARRIESRVEQGVILSEERWRLIGALFTHEFSIEGAALTNPSMVLHPDQTGLEDGSTRFIMSVRCIGEGHRSSIGFREGVITEEGGIEISPPGLLPVIGTQWEPLLRQENFRGLLEDMGDLGENSRFILSQLGETFSTTELNEVLFRILDGHDSFRNADQTVHHFRHIAERNYSVTFPHEHDISERVMWPVATSEWRGMEDARFVRFQEDDGTIKYLATYTAFDGNNISQQLLTTSDFSVFEIHPLAGDAAKGKGMAIFPRKIGGMYAAMSRSDHESNSVTFSDHLEYWAASMQVQRPSKSWDLIQMGNSGSPIETEAGWLLLTHAVGPMRTYCISAVLLDLDDPARVIGELDGPLLAPRFDERDGYVPNVVYSCGSMAVADNLVLPFGVADNSIGIATLSLSSLLDQLTS